MPDNSEFEEIALANARIELLRGKAGEVALRLSATGHFVAMQVGVSLDGERLEYWPMRGMCSNPSPLSQMVPVMLVSDKEGHFGRICPKCRGYFRTKKIPPALYCPYCGLKAELIWFTTANQRQFIDKVREDWLKAFRGEDIDAIDLDAITQSLPENRPAWVYSEERQQHRCDCSKCSNCFDILGEYGRCPSCGVRNWLQVLLEALTDVERRFIGDSASINGEVREIDWQGLTTCVSSFEGMARDVQIALADLPLTDQRRKQVQRISFQQVLRANELLLQFFGFELLGGIMVQERDFLDQMFNRRHILTHNSGRVDEKYLRRTNDSTVRLHEKIRVTSEELHSLISLLKRIAENLTSGFDSIKQG